MKQLFIQDHDINHDILTRLRMIQSTKTLQEPLDHNRTTIF